MIDSGATRHISEQLRSLHNSTVTLPNHVTIPVNYCGDIILSDYLNLHNALYVPCFKFNLIYVSALTKESNVGFSFFDNHFEIQDIKRLKTIGRGEKCNDLYVLTKYCMITTTTFVNTVSSEIWHKRLGHLSFKCLDVLKSRLSYHDSDHNMSTPCCICPLAKQHRLPFISANNFSSFCFEFVNLSF